MAHLPPDRLAGRDKIGGRGGGATIGASVPSPYDHKVVIAMLIHTHANITEVSADVIVNAFDKNHRKNGAT